MENYVHDKLICFKCKRTYSLTLQANSVAEAISIFREIQSGARKLTGYYFTLPIYEYIQPTPCSNCTGSKSINPEKLDWSFQRNEFKQPLILVKKGDKWLRPDRPESRSKEHQTLIALRNRSYVFTPDPDPSNHIQQCNCTDCYNRKAQVIAKKSETIGAYNQVLNKLGMPSLSETEVKSIPVNDDPEVKPLKRNYDAEIGIGAGMNYKRPNSDQIDEWYDNFTFFWKDLAKAVN